MAAYAALVSVLHLIEKIQHHPCPPVSLDKDDVQSLTKKITFLQEFLEDYSHVRNEEAVLLQSRIADAAYDAEDVIESHIVDQILARSTNHAEKISGYNVDFYQAFEKVIRVMDLIIQDVMEILVKMGSVQEIEKNTPLTKADSASYKAFCGLNMKIEMFLQHPCPSFSLYKDQLQSLINKDTFVKEFLEVYSSFLNEEADCQLQRCLVDATHRAKHVIESYVENHIFAQPANQAEKISGSDVDFNQALEKVIQVVDIITKDVMEILLKMGSIQDIEVDRTVEPPLAKATSGALCSLRYLIEKIQHHSLPLPNRDQLQSLAKKVTFLQAPQLYSLVRNEKIGQLHSRILYAVYKAEDAIQSHLVDQFLDQFTTPGKQISTVDFYQGLQKVIHDMDLIMKEAMGIKEKMGSVRDIQQYGTGSTSVAASLRYSSTKNSTMVGFDNGLEEIMDKLTRQQSNCQIIPIVGMGGIGKTTLAKNVYENPLIVQHFDIRAWTTISQEFNAKELLRSQGIKESFNDTNEEKLGEMLYKNLFDRRYLIIMDNMWNIEAWDQLKRYFPHNNCEGSIIITSRLSDLASHLPGACGFQMSFLNEDKSWNLFCRIVFEENGCPPELEKTGKKISKRCEGLPLSIVVTRGLPAKFEQTLEYWEFIAENLSLVVNLEDNEQCLNVLYMSYNYLSVHLKPCFLYLGVYGEDDKIHVSKLIKLWVAEGFLKTINGKNLEEVEEEYLKTFVDRNLILVKLWKQNGKPKLCKMHDLLRDLCLREAEKDKFLCVTRQQGLNKLPHDINTQRHIAIHQSRLWQENDECYLPEIRDSFQFASRARTLAHFSLKILSSCNFRLSRVLETSEERIRVEETLDFPFHLVNLRYLAIAILPLQLDFPRVPSSFYLFWNLQTLIVGEAKLNCFDIWKMPLLRHVKWKPLYLNDPGQDGLVLGNLQTLSTIKNFKCGEEVVKRIPNIQKLKISFSAKASHYCLNNLGRLHTLDSLNCEFSWEPSWSDLVQNLTFPHSLEKLTLGGCYLHSRDISTKIGSLPHLPVLKLSVIGPEWETVEGQFLNLKFFELRGTELEHWTTEACHFPRLEHLFLFNLWSLKEIPLDIGNIPTLKLVEVYNCSRAAVVSSNEIVEEQNYPGNEDIQVRVCLSRYRPDEEIKRMASHNFLVDFDL